MKYLHGNILVLVLRTFALTGNHQPCWQVGQSNSTTGLLHMLSSRSTRPEDINLQIIRVYLNINAGCSFYQRRPADKDGALLSHNHGLIAHSRLISSARSA